MPLIIILVESGIELIPKEIRNHPAVRKNFSAQLYSSQLLDTAFHHTAIRNLKNPEKRGRPDITHLCLLNALGSPLNKSGNLRLFIHTINNKIYKFNPEIKIARNYNRFKGLMAKLLIDGDVNANGIPLISEFKGELQELIDKFKDPRIFLFSSRGKLIQNYKELYSEDLSENIVAIIGGYQKGNFSDYIMGLCKNLISISKYPLDAWVVISKIINMYELSHNID
ncbi:MAG: 16S rRNA methyltransferase [Candidatus Lokiarchaeota archaeon]|nr:16S rRNA methyltransferase [Candidatus Lokiarchaeota archaeon]